MKKKREVTNFFLFIQRCKFPQGSARVPFAMKSSDKVGNGEDDGPLETGKEVKQLENPYGFQVQEAQPHWGTEQDLDLHLVLVHPEIPGNTGNVGRLCAGTKVWLHLVEPLGFELSNRYLKRAGLDYWPHVQLCVHPDFEAVEEIFPAEKMAFFTKKAEKNYAEVKWKPGSVLVFGCETRGLPAEIRERHEERLVRIPTTDKVRSLNLSNACAIGLYEAMRQLEWAPMGEGP